MTVFYFNFVRYWGSVVIEGDFPRTVHIEKSMVLPILEYCSQVWRSVAECDLQLRERQVYSVARFCPDRSVLLCHRRRVVGLITLYKVNSNSNHSLFSKLPSAPTRVRHTHGASAAHSLQFEVSRCRTSQFSRCFLPAQVQM